MFAICCVALTARGRRGLQRFTSLAHYPGATPPPDDSGRVVDRHARTASSTARPVLDAGRRWPRVSPSLYVAGWFLTGDRVPKGVSVAGVDIGGLSADEAAAELDDESGRARESAPIVVQYDDQTYEIDPADVGLALDTEATVSEAGGGRSWNPVRMVDILLGDSGDVDSGVRRRPGRPRRRRRRHRRPDRR